MEFRSAIDAEQSATLTEAVDENIHILRLLYINLTHNTFEKSHDQLLEQITMDLRHSGESPPLHTREPREPSVPTGHREPRMDVQ